MSALENIVAEHTAEPIELPRLTVHATFLTYGRIGNQLGVASDAFKALPETNNVQDATERLKEIVKACGHVIRSAERLLEGNR